MDAMGRDVIIIETVGVGQVELDIVKLAYTSVVVLAPGMGDDIQAMKAGIMEIGDIFVFKPPPKSVSAAGAVSPLEGAVQNSQATDDRH